MVKISPDEDLRQRWLPTGEQTAAAIAVLRTVPQSERGKYLAVAVLVQPGKEFGFWETGQQVVALPGIWLGENVPFEQPSLMPFGDAKAAAEAVGHAWLVREGLSGTVATAVIDDTGHAAVFEAL